MMNEAKHTKTILILGLLLMLLVTHLPVVYTYFYHKMTDFPKAEDGSISINTLAPKENIILDGRWEFYWKSLIATEPQQNQTPDFYIEVPDYWSKYKVDGKWLSANGYGSYRLVLRDFSYPDPVTVYLPDFGSAYRTYIDGELVSESGRLSKDSSAIFTMPKSQIYPAVLKAGALHEIVIEVASTRFSGLYMAPVLKDYKSAIQENTARSNIRFILFGMVLCSCFVLIIVYSLSRQKRTQLVWLPMMVVCVLLRIMLTTEFYSFWQDKVFFNLSYESTNEMMFLITFVFKFLLIFLIQEQFGVTFTGKERTAFFAYYAALYLAFLAIPQGIYNRHMTIVLPVSTFALETYSFFKIYFGRQRLKKYGLLIYMGVILVIAGLAVDSYYINGNIFLNMSMVLLIALTVYLMLISLVYALRLADEHNEFAVASSRLEMANSQINMQREYYDALSAQINEVRGIRHDLCHFAGVIGRLSQEARYPELENFLEEYVDKIDMDPLPVFCENVVANSILGYHFLKARENGIQFHSACSIQQELHVKDSDICIVLGNALENAIEACCKIDHPGRRCISVEARSINSQLLIKIENTHNNGLNFQSGVYRTTKSVKFHGIGMRNISKVVAAYGGYVKSEHTEEAFTLMVAFASSQ